MAVHAGAPIRMHPAGSETGAIADNVGGATRGGSGENLTVVLALIDFRILRKAANIII